MRLNVPSFLSAFLLLAGCSGLVEQASRPSAAIRVSIQGEFNKIITATPAITLSATTNDNAGVSWELTSDGNPCSPYCGNLVFSNGPHLAAVYTPPLVLANGTSRHAEISAKSITDPKKSDSFKFMIVAASQAGYAILLRGYDSAGTPLAMAGVLVADPTGNITGGELDINDGGNTTHFQGLQGVFGTDTNFAGIIRGTVTITNAKFPGTAVNPVFKFVLRGTETEGRLVEFDATGNLLAGTMLLQSGVSSQLPSGVFAFGVDSDAPIGGRTVEVGALEMQSNGTVAGVADQSQARSAVVQQAQPLAGTAEVPDALGRGTADISLNGVDVQYAYYAVAQDQLFLLQIGGNASPNTVFSGTARGHAFNFDPVNGIFTTSVFQLTGMEVLPHPQVLAPDAAIGLAQVSADNSVSITCDTNDAGSVGIGSSLAGSLASYDSNTGRAVFAIAGGGQSGLADTLVVYYYDDGAGFAVGEATAGGVISRGFSGTLARQVSTGFNSQSISGPLIGVSGGSSVPGIPAVEAAISADPAAATLAGIAYAEAQQGPLPNVSFQATFSNIDPGTGHGSARFPGAIYGDFTPQAMDSASFYLIGANRFVSIGTQTGTLTGVSYYSPD